MQYDRLQSANEKKCSEIIQRCFRPVFHNKLVEGTGDGNHSLFLDELHDITVLEILRIAVIYFTKISKKVVSTFLNLKQLESYAADVN